MSLLKRISIVDKAILTATGNTAVICGSATEVLINTSDMVTVNGTPTRDYTKSGSSAVLEMLTDSKVLYAELLWYSTVTSTFQGAVDVRSIQDNPITVTMPNGDIQSIKPDNGQDFVTFATGETVRFRSANVTSLIQTYLGGTYIVSNIPTSIPPTGINNSRCAWSLNVIYRNNTLSTKKIDFLSGIAYSTSTVPYQTTFSGFTTSSDPNSLKGSMLLTVANGLPLSGTETVSIGPSLANLTVLGNPVGAPHANPLTAPNNPYNNFFAGLINHCNPLNSNMGLINITGTNGTNNNDAFVPTQIVGARNKWDMTGIDISNTLVANQTQLAFQVVSGQYSVQIMSVGTQIEAVAPDVVVDFSVYNSVGLTDGNVHVGERLLYSVDITNSGEMAADHVILTINPGSYASILQDTLSVNSVALSGDITKGVDIGTIPSYGASKVTFEVDVTGLPPMNQTTGKHSFNNAVKYSYQFISGIDTITNSGETNVVTLKVEQGSVSIVKTSSSTVPAVGSTVVYTNVLTNTGTQLLTSVVYQDVDTAYTSFVPDSVYINNVQMTGLDPTIGFPLSNLVAGSVTTIKYSIKIDAISPSGTIDTRTALKYGYLLDPFTNVIYQTSYSNVLSLIPQYSQIVKKTVASTDYPKVGDILTYDTSLTNVGNVAAANVVMKDTAIMGYSFIDGTVTVNGTAVAGVNPYIGFTLSAPIAAGATTIVEYRVLVNAIPVKELIDNTAEVPYQYKITDEQGIITDRKSSNTVETLSNYVCMAMTETVSRTCAKIDDRIYYSVLIENTGNINASNTMFSSNIQSETGFVDGSVKVNGISYPSYNPITGFSVGIVYPGNSVTVSYAVSVLTVPLGGIVYNQSNLAYGYMPDPLGSIITSTITSNRVQTNINDAAYTAVMSVDKRYAVLGDSLVYTTTINNVGTTMLNDVRFYDNLPSFVKFITGTVYVNGIKYETADPTASFVLQSLHPGDTARIVFAVQVIAVPSAKAVINKGVFDLSYQTCSDSPVVTVSTMSNEVRTIVISGSLSMNKTVDKVYGKQGDFLQYSFSVINTGNVPVQNVLFSDYISSSLQFVPGSVIVNNVSKPDYNPITGFSLGDMNVEQSVTISFQSMVISIPNPNTISNYGTSTYTYVINPAEQPVTQSVNSNTVTTVVNKSDAAITKQVDKAYSTVNDTLTYTLVVNNKGTVPMTSVTILDLLQKELSFVTGSVVVNGVMKPEFNPNNGFVIDDIAASGTSTILYKTKVISTPSDYTILNSGNVGYQYVLVPSEPTKTENKTSNTVKTNINSVSVSNVKSVNKAYTTVNDILQYTSIITNNSTINLSDTLFTDIIPMDTTFVLGSVTVDNVSYTQYNPQDGFTLGTIVPNQSVTVRFNVAVVQTPTVQFIENHSNVKYSYQLYPNIPDIIYDNTLSNTVTTIVRYGVASITKEADRLVARLDDTITYQIIIANIGNALLNTVSFIDVIQSDTTFVADSVYINGVQQIGLNPTTGFTLSDLLIGTQAVVVFKVKVTAIPSVDGVVYNKGTVNYSYYVDPTGTPIATSKESNTTEVQIKDTIVSATKAVNYDFAKINQILSYTVVVTNKGNVTATNVNFTDVLDPNLSFVAQSVYINTTQYTSYDPNQGFSLPDIVGGGSVTITFSATIISRPDQNIIYNSASMTYQYIIGGTTYYGEMSTNIVSTKVAYGNLTIVKAVDREYANMNDTMNYTLTIKNTGTVKTTKLNLSDVIQSEAMFLTGSVFVDDVNYTNYNPNNGFVITDLEPNEGHIITFAVKVITMPINRKIDNTGTIAYTYQLTTGDSPVTTTASSNLVTTYVNIGKLTVTKEVDMSYATLTNEVTYTMYVTNIGNVICNNVLFKDLIQSEASFVAQSVYINDVHYAAYNPNTGFQLQNIDPAAIIKIVFKAMVNTLPSNQILFNTATVNYEYTSNPDSSPILISAVSNTVQTFINIGSITVVKSVDKEYATIGDTMVYTVDINNVGTVNAIAVNFRDVLRAGVSFVSGSVTIGGSSYPTYNPYDSFTLGIITPGQSVQVKFKAKVDSLPVPNTVTNTANIIFSYYINPTGTITTVQKDSNTVNTVINVATMTINKAVDKSYATANEVITYNFTVKNTGNVDLSNVAFIDNLQSDVTFNTGSVTVNGVPKTGFDPTQGFSLGTVTTLATITVSFTVTVIAKPVNSSVINFGYTTYAYKINPSGETYTKTTESNTVYTTLVLPSIIGTKTVDLVFSTIGDVLNYTILIKNTGNYLLSSVYFVDTLSSGGTFIPGTVYIDGINYPTYSPIIGFDLPNLIAGNTSKVQFQTSVAVLPSPPVITNYAISNAKCVITQTGKTIEVTALTNTTTTNVVIGSLSIAKAVDKMYARVSDIVTYSNVITNNGNTDAKSILFKDLLQAELSFVTGSVQIGGISYPDLNPNTGFALADLVKGASVTVSFDAVINALPVPPVVNNTSVATFRYQIDPSGTVYTGSSTSNTVSTNVVKAQVNAVKNVDKTIATVGDDLTYTITLTNTGNVAANDIIFTDIPATGASFKAGTVIVNGVAQSSYNPVVGFSVPSIPTGSVATIQFKVTVVSVPTTNTIINTATASYSYLVDPKQPPYNSTTISNPVTTNIALGKLEVNKVVDKAYATIGDKLTYTITMKNVGNINATNVQFLDPTPSYTLFVTGSVTVNGLKYPAYNPEVGFNIGTIIPGQTMTVTYQVQIKELCTSN